MVDRHKVTATYGANTVPTPSWHASIVPRERMGLPVALFAIERVGVTGKLCDVQIRTVMIRAPVPRQSPPHPGCAAQNMSAATKATTRKENLCPADVGDETSSVPAILMSAALPPARRPPTTRTPSARASTLARGIGWVA